MKYDGNFENDCKHGLGILYFKNGEKYIGNFIQDAIFGEGAFYRKNGEVILGVWENNMLIKRHWIKKKKEKFSKLMNDKKKYQYVRIS